MLPLLLALLGLPAEDSLNKLYYEHILLPFTPPMEFFTYIKLVSASESSYAS